MIRSMATSKRVSPLTAAGSIRCLRRHELPRDTAELARYLVGKTLVRELPRVLLAGRIVETEAYEVGDAAGHAYRGQTARNRSLFLRRGHAYVYFIYGCWFAVNVSAESEDIGAGVLIRALEPTHGVDCMALLRGRPPGPELARGPGRLATAMAIDRRLDGIDLCRRGPLWLGTAQRALRPVGVSSRIGITREVERKLRYFERDNACVSGPRSLGRAPGRAAVRVRAPRP
jgi:DNA-3-methyladenine glycosylase